MPAALSANLRALVLKGIGTDRAAEEGGNAGARRCDCLVETFAPRAGAKFTDHLVAGSREFFHIKRQILIKAADN